MGNIEVKKRACTLELNALLSILHIRSASTEVKMPQMRRELPRLHGVKEASRMLGIAPQTLRDWETKGKIKAEYNAAGHRQFTPEVIEEAYEQGALRRAGRKPVVDG